MRISVLLRLAPAAVAANQLAGEAEVVATGQRAVVRSADELLAFVTAAGGEATAESVATPHHPTSSDAALLPPHGSMPARRRMGGSAR